MGFSHRATHLFYYSVEVAAVFSCEFNYKDHSFLACFFDWKRRACTAKSRRVALFNGFLNVLGIKVSSSHNDAILQPPGNKQIACVKKTKIAGSQVGPFAAP